MFSGRGFETGGPALRTARLPAVGAFGLASLCLVLAVATALIPAGPSYDPWSWIVWGREVMEGDLQTTGAVSWKPLPVLFTAPFSLFGDAAPNLWLLVARALAFGAVIAAASIGARLAGRLGGVLAGASLLISASLWDPVLLGGSEGGAILFVLAAVDRHLAGRFGQAFAWGVAAGLVRPEAWVFLCLYAVWLGAREPARLRWIVPSLGFMAALWLLPELWGSGQLWRGAERAQQHINFGPALAARPALAVAESALRLTPAVVVLGLLAGLAAMAVRAAPRTARAPALGLGLLGLGWLAVVALMTEAGFSGRAGYLLVPVAVAHVLAGVGFAWAFDWLSKPARRRALRLAATAGLAALGLYGVGRIVSLEWPPMLERVARHDRVNDDLERAVARAGGRRRLEACGTVYASNQLTPPVAWTFHRHLRDVTAAARPPGVVLRSRILEDQPLDPPRKQLAGSSERRVIARTKYWEVEVGCGPARRGGRPSDKSAPVGERFRP